MKSECDIFKVLNGKMSFIVSFSLVSISSSILSLSFYHFIISILSSTKLTAVTYAASSLTSAAVSVTQ